MGQTVLMKRNRWNALCFSFVAYQVTIFVGADPFWITGNVTNITAFAIEYDFSESGEFKELEVVGVNTGATTLIDNAFKRINPLAL
jgi:hypothetical protein